MKHEHRQHEQHQPDLGHGGHQEHERPPQRNQPDPHRNHNGHGQQPSQQHAGHDKHAGHSPEIFKRRFFICLVLTLPVLYFEPMFQMWFNYQAIQFSGAEWVIPIFSTIIYFYSNWGVASSGQKSYGRSDRWLTTIRFIYPTIIRL